MTRGPRNPVTRRLTIAEIAIVIALAMVALWLVTGSMEYADRAKTMWPSFLLDFSPPLLSFRALWISHGRRRNLFRIEDGWDGAESPFGPLPR